MTWLSEDRAQHLYAPHEGKEFYQGLVDFITSGPIVAVAVEGTSAIEITRNMVRDKKPEDAASGIIRGAHSMDMRYNVVYASDSMESAFR